MDRPQICRRAAQGNRPGSWFLYRDWIRDRSVFMPKNKKRSNNPEICCFYIFHRFALKYGKGYTMLRWSASKFFITSCQNVEKCEQCWDQPLPNLSLGRARDIGKIIVFQGKRIDFRIIGILENLLFSTKNKQTIFRTKTNGKLHQICTKSLKMWHFKRLWECFFCLLLLLLMLLLMLLLLLWMLWVLWIDVGGMVLVFLVVLLLMVMRREREDRKARTAKREKRAKEQGRSLYTP